MKKVALVFMLAVFAPSLILAWLAMRSLRDQQLVVERQQTMLYQGVVDGIAREAAAVMTGKQREFQQHVQSLLAARMPRDITAAYDERLRTLWPDAEVGFAVSLEGQVLAPSLFASSEARKFRLENDRFLCNRETVEVYWNSPKGSINLSRLDQKQSGDSGKEDGKDAKAVFATKSGKVPATASQKEPGGGDVKGPTEQAEFRALVGDSSEGSLARFEQNKLKVMFWYRPARDPQVVFGVQMRMARLTESLRQAIQLDSALNREFVAALLDDAIHPVQITRTGYETNWRKPFVSADIGEMLPHWQVAGWLLDPSGPKHSAQVLRLTLGLLICLLVVAISTGSWLIGLDLKRQLRMARQKTDFVSNVSHELKTPLTSIRMFSEILAEGRVQGEEKRRHYLQIINAETSRLTRLINNVLDFARMERGEKLYKMETVDFIALSREIVDTYRPHLEASGFNIQSEFPPGPVFVRGDRDALSQVIVNLVSNAEKYGGDRKEIRVELHITQDAIEVWVMDRGPGVSAEFSERIFEQFYRAHDSLASGIQGSGLGLTLARQIARAHEGNVSYSSRPGGGSCFVFNLPRAHETRGNGS
ncbi:MAG TPA: HAMP domain-containing sensor histidine kinase [Candidatus Saccharimonadales bacterium]|nr:HAMP domain-containing sensor histidine kinase [Candidatus Saccharimonadales bacterium]